MHLNGKQKIQSAEQHVTELRLDRVEQQLHQLRGVVVRQRWLLWWVVFETLALVYLLVARLR